MKRILQRLFILMFLMTSLVSTSFAQETDVKPFVMPDNVEVEILNELSVKEQMYNKNLMDLSSLSRSIDTPVAEISIFATADGPASSFNTSGHVWIYIYNWSRSSFTVGNKVVKPGTGVTIGTFGNQGYDGVWYNLESYFSAHTNYSYTSEINASDISKISNYIDSHDKWKMSFNCSHFASGLWNSTSISKKFSGGTPSQVVPQIKNSSGYRKNKPYPVSGNVAHN